MSHEIRKVELSDYSQIESTGDGRVWVNTTETQDIALYQAGLRKGMLVRLILEVIPCDDCGQPAQMTVEALPKATSVNETCRVCNGYNEPGKLPCPECQGCGLHDCHCSPPDGDIALAVALQDFRNQLNQVGEIASPYEINAFTAGFNAANASSSASVLIDALEHIRRKLIPLHATLSPTLSAIEQTCDAALDKYYSSKQ